MTGSRTSREVLPPPTPRVTPFGTAGSDISLTYTISSHSSCSSKTLSGLLEVLLVSEMIFISVMYTHEEVETVHIRSLLDKAKLITRSSWRPSTPKKNKPQDTFLTDCRVKDRDTDFRESFEQVEQSVPLDNDAMLSEI